MCLSILATGKKRVSILVSAASWGYLFWRHRDENNILILHYADITRSLGGEMRKIAARLQIEIDVRVVSDLVKAEGFGAMKVLVDTLVPVAKANLWKKKAQFLLN